MGVSFFPFSRSRLLGFDHFLGTKLFVGFQFPNNKFEAAFVMYIVNKKNKILKQENFFFSEHW